MPAYVNYLGDEIGLISHPVAPKPKKGPEAFHKGWRVSGVPPGELEKARAAHKRAGVGKWDEAAWLMSAKQKPVRTKPYALREAASECAALAGKTGWLRVEIVEVKRGEAPKPSAALMKRKGK